MVDRVAGNGGSCDNDLGVKTTEQRASQIGGDRGTGRTRGTGGEMLGIIIESVERRTQQVPGLLVRR